ncbi:MAG: Phosphate regulon sensor protein PhoR (SphS) (EC [uncultured Thiotrichaceae bacterium]|uniref:Phosphate regulon sensor protein PhoR n=1 Tax=uncultured Thiotrichaceae bacterium TaxID=298394 RepID=A0A6S6SZA1_9GAMM|nr:MAG: Phosphate regulon sensor protein PhoR (SphS) (EC [uncultured Thiotrichaceae bacterium]
MDRESKSTEIWRIIFVLLAGIAGGIVTGYWEMSLIVALAAYIAWLLYKLQQLHVWLKDGAKPLHVPDSDGAWEHITQQIQYTQRKSAQRKKSMSKLLKRFQGIIKSLPYATVVLNGNNEIDWANKASMQLLRLDLKKDRGQRIDNLIRMPEVQRLLTKYSEKEIEINSPYNEQIKLSLQLIPVHSDLKLLIARDISEQVRLQQMRKNFIANASHELRTPLTVIAGYLEIIQDDASLPEHLEPAVTSAAEQSARMQMIIEDLLTLSRLENVGLSKNQDQVLSVASIINSICNSEAQLISNDTHKIILDTDPDLNLKGVEVDITSVCVNLIHNAIRHTPVGTEVHVTWKQLATNEACFIVRDTGNGIPAEHIPRLTERFYRVDQGRSKGKGGTGLGMAIVLHIVQLHEASLLINSTVGEGTTFTVFFPAIRVSRS